MGTTAHSDDLRSRVVAEVLAGASRHQAAERFKVSAASAVRWAQLHSRTGGVDPRPRGGKSRSPLEATFGLAAGFDHRGTGPDAGSDRAEALGRSWAAEAAVRRFFKRHAITFKKSCTPPNTTGPTYPWLANVGRQARRALTPPNWCSSTRRAPTARWSASTDDVEGASDSSARPPGVIGGPQPSPAACAATVFRTVGAGRSHDRRRVPHLRREGARPNPLARRHCHHRQSLPATRLPVCARRSRQ
jgi:hypothetical protein